GMQTRALDPVKQFATIERIPDPGYPARSKQNRNREKNRTIVWLARHRGQTVRRSHGVRKNRPSPPAARDRQIHCAQKDRPAHERSTSARWEGSKGSLLARQGKQRRF